MNTLEKIEALGKSAQYDICASCGKGASRVSGPLGKWIYPSVLPDGKNILMFKVLMSNYCLKDCSYCVNRNSVNSRHYSFKPDELAELFMKLFFKRLVHALFLSSAVFAETDVAMEKMINVAEILRFKYKFKGYIHLKILPGTSPEYLQKAIQLAQRVSVNLEAPNPKRLKQIANGKDFHKDLLLRMKWIKSLVEKSGSTTDQTTQFMVGAANEPDKEILNTTDYLYKDLKLSRVYFSAFQPLRDTPFESFSPTPLIREHRLYQVDFLFRKYGFKLNEIIFDESGNLPLKEDPKMVLALNSPDKFPVEINKASKSELLRVPGIGPKSASLILKMRTKSKIKNLGELRKIGIVAKRSAPFILINGRQAERNQQLSLINNQSIF
ncbi:MAG: radical SAM protein [Actinobacteria bacterium]|nr:radical SAM protein [Actinomycetota bacterium]